MWKTVLAGPMFLISYWDVSTPFQSRSVPEQPGWPAFDPNVPGDLSISHLILPPS